MLDKLQWPGGISLLYLTKFTEAAAIGKSNI